MKDTKKLLLVIAIVIFSAAITSGVWFYVNQKESKKYETKIEALSAELAQWGTPTTVYTVAATVKSGDEVTAESLVPMKLPSTCVTPDMVVNTSDIIGKFYKIALANGVPVTQSLFMEETVTADVRDVDITVSRWTVGLTVGDYVDINITMPYGDDYIVIPRKRVYAVNENTIKLHMSREEWHKYQGALVEYYLNSAYGATVYAQKYVEPGLQTEAVPYYAVPENILAIIQKDPNVVDKAYAEAAASWRASIEQLLVIFRDDEDTVDSDGTKLSEGREKHNESVVTDATEKKQAESKETADTPPTSNYTEVGAPTEEIVE